MGDKEQEQAAQLFDEKKLEKAVRGECNLNVSYVRTNQERESLPFCGF